jgi:hypothetical protein
MISLFGKEGLREILIALSLIGWPLNSSLSCWSPPLEKETEVMVILQIFSPLRGEIRVRVNH